MIGGRFAAFGSAVLIATGVAMAPAIVGAAESPGFTEKLGRKATRGAMQEAIETLDEPLNRIRLGRSLGSLPMQAAMRDLSKASILGIADGIQAAMAGEAIGKAGQAIGRTIERDVAPAVGRATARVVDAVLESALSDGNVAKLQAFIETATRAFIRGIARELRQELSPAVAAAIERDLGPALATVIERDLGPALATVLERDLVPALARGLNDAAAQDTIAYTIETIASHTVLGTERGMDEVRRRNEETGEESGLTIFGNRLAIGYALAVIFAVTFITLFIVTAVMLSRQNRRHGELIAGIRRREEQLADLLQSVETDETRNALIERLRDAPPPEAT